MQNLNLKTISYENKYHIFIERLENATQSVLTLEASFVQPFDACNYAKKQAKKLKKRVFVYENDKKVDLYLP